MKITTVGKSESHTLNIPMHASKSKSHTLNIPMPQDQGLVQGKPVTTTVAFDRATYKQLRLLAVERETNVRDLIREAVKNLLQSTKKKGRP